MGLDSLVDHCVSNLKENAKNKLSSYAGYPGPINHDWTARSVEVPQTNGQG